MHGHVIWCNTYHRCMVMSYNASSSIDAWSCRIMHHLPSMHCHVTYYFTFHRCMVMSCDIMHHLPSMHIMHHLPSMHVNIIWCLIMLYDTVMSYNASPTVYGIYLPYDTSSNIDDAYSWHLIHHLQSCHMIHYLPSCLVISCDTSPIIDARQCHLIHHLPSMQDNVIWYINYNWCMVMSFNATPTIDAC